MNHSELMFGLILWLNLFFNAFEGPPATPSKFSPAALQERRVAALQGLPSESALVAFLDLRSLQEHLAQTPAFQLLRSERFQQLRPWLRQWMENTGSANKMELISDLRQLGEEFGPFGLISFSPGEERWAGFIDGLEASTEAERNELLQAALPRFRAVFRKQDHGGVAAWVGSRLVFVTNPNDLQFFSPPTQPPLDQTPEFRSQAEELRSADFWLYAHIYRLLEPAKTRYYSHPTLAAHVGIDQFKFMTYTLAPGTNGLAESLRVGYAHEAGSRKGQPEFDVIRLLEDGQKPIRGASHVPRSVSLAWDIRLWDQRSDNRTQLVDALSSVPYLGASGNQFMQDCTGEMLVWLSFPQSGPGMPPDPDLLDLARGKFPIKFNTPEGSILLSMPPEFTLDKLKSTFQKDGPQPMEELYRGVPVLYVVPSSQTLFNLLAFTVQDGFLGIHSTAAAARSYIDARLDGKTLPASASAEMLYLALDQFVDYESIGSPQTLIFFGNPREQQRLLKQFQGFLAELGPSFYERRALEGQSVWTSRSAFGFGGHPFYSFLIFFYLY